MTPDQIAKANTEHSHQAAFFCECQRLKKTHPCLEFIHAIPNGGERNIAVASRLKAEGVKAGCPDVFLPFPRIKDNQVQYHGLYIEFKRPKSEGKAIGKLSPEQEKWRDFLVLNNFSHFVAYDYLQAVEVLLRYLN